jgi:hypothetical protein
VLVFFDLGFVPVAAAVAIDRLRKESALNIAVNRFLASTPALA